LSPSEYRLFIVAAAICHLIAFACFAICTDGRPRQSVDDISPLLQRAYLLMYAVDSNRNAFPSLHAVDSALLIRMLLPQRYGGWLALWGVLVMFSSLLIKQYTAADVVAGVLLAVTVLELWRALTQRADT
jgi:membrane-associated phospholipid phosphatase